MKEDKIYSEKTSRIIQTKTLKSDTLQFMDNRPLTTSQMMLNTPAQRAESDKDEDTLQGKFNGTIQRAEEEEEESLQMKAYGTIQKKANNTGLPDNLKSGVENLSGFSMDDVRVHYNSDKPASVQAHAFTQGTDIHVAPGQELHLPHEAWHVAQQMAGRVEPTTEIGGMPVNDNIGLEHEADMMGLKASSF